MPVVHEAGVRYQINQIDTLLIFYLLTSSLTEISEPQVWAIFAPKLVFEIAITMVTNVCWVSHLVSHSVTTAFFQSPNIP